MAFTLARTKPSSSAGSRHIYKEGVLEEDACLRRQHGEQILAARVERITCSRTSLSSSSFLQALRFLLMSWSAPIASPVRERSGAQSIDFVR